MLGDIEPAKLLNGDSTATLEKEMVAQITQILIWPVVFIIAVLILKKPLSTLVRMVSQIKYKDLSIFFNNKMDDLIAAVPPEESIQGSEIGRDAHLANLPPIERITQTWRITQELVYEKLLELFPPDSEQSVELTRDWATTALSISGALTPAAEKIIGDLESFVYDLGHIPTDSITEEMAQKFEMLNKYIQDKVESLTELPQIKLTALTIMILIINSLIDSGKYADITMDQIKVEIDNGQVLEYLGKNMGKDVDLSLILPNERMPDGLYPGFIQFYSERLQRLSTAYSGDEGKWGVANSGLSLLLAWTNEIIQQGGGWHPND